MFALMTQQLNQLEKAFTASRDTQNKLPTHPAVTWHQFQKSHATFVVRAEQWNEVIELGK
jgi:hypothetical protein